MNILWTVNLIPSEASQVLGINSVVLGGWVESMAQRLKNYPEIKLAIACKTDKANTFDEEINGIRYFSIGYDGKTELKTLENMCNDIIESTSTHDFKFCKCGAVAVDGGHDYLRRCGNRENWEELSEVEE